MAPKLRNCCKLEQVGIQVLQDGRVLAKEATNWKIEGQKRRISREEYQRLLNKFEMEVFMAQKGLWKLGRERGAGQRSVA